MRTLKHETDSREYRFAYRLKTASDLPSDFALPISPAYWKHAIFVPGDTSDRWAMPKYPPRIYVLTESGLAVYVHPAAGEASFTCPFRRLVEISSYRSLLHGELEFRSNSLASGRLLYGTVQRKVVDSFLRELRSRWLPTKDPHVTSPPVFPVWGIDHRCLHALERELDANERVIQACYQPTFVRRSSRWWYTFKEEIAACAIAYTNRRIVLAMEGQQELQEPYGVRLRSVPVIWLKTVRQQRNDSVTIFSFVFANALAWQLWIRPEDTAAIEDLLAALRAENPTID